MAGKTLWNATALLALAATAGFGQDAMLDELYGRGVHAFFSGNQTEAFNSLNAAIKSGSRDPRAFYYRGLILNRFGRPAEAADDFKKGAELEILGGEPYPIGRALERIQGAERVTLEAHRRAARLAIHNKQSAEERARYEEIKRAENNVLRGGGAPNLPPPVPTGRPDPSDPFAAPAAPSPLPAPAVPAAPMPAPTVTAPPAADPFAPAAEAPVPANAPARPAAPSRPATPPADDPFAEAPAATTPAAPATPAPAPPSDDPFAEKPATPAPATPAPVPPAADPFAEPTSPPATPPAPKPAPPAADDPFAEPATPTTPAPTVP